MNTTMELEKPDQAIDQNIKSLVDRIIEKHDGQASNLLQILFDLSFGEDLKLVVNN